MPDLKVSNVNKTFNGNKVLHDINFEVHDGEFFTLLGPSGCGKSTTLACIAGLESPDEGTISLDDTVFFSGADRTFVAPEGRNLGMVFQSYALWPHMTIADNLALPLKLRKVAKARRNELIDDALEKVDLLHLRSRYPHEMSGGQQQRVALARALVYSPRLLLDEPLSNLDAKLREQARAWLKALQSEVGITTIYVTHDQEEALAMSDRIAVMARGEMVQIATPTEIYEQPAAQEVAAFVGSCNFLDAHVVEAGPGDARVKLDATGQLVHATGRMDVRSGDAVTVAVRPERVNIAAAGHTPAHGLNVVRANVSSVQYVGSRYEYLLSVGESTIAADCLKSGHQGEVDLVIDPENIFLYPQKQAVPA